MRRVLEDLDPARAGDRLDRGHVGRASGEVDGEDHARARRDSLGNAGRVDVHRPAIAVGEDDASPDVEDGVRRGDEGERGRDDLVLRLHAEGDQREMEPGRAGGEGDRVRAPT